MGFHLQGLRGNCSSACPHHRRLLHHRPLLPHQRPSQGKLHNPLLLLVPRLFLLWPMACLQSHALNLIVRGLFTVSLTLAVGVMCANPYGDGRIVLEAFILTSAMAASLTGYAS